MRALRTRLRRLERATRKQRIVVVEGHTEAEFDRQLNELESRGLIDSERDVIVCLRRFCGEEGDLLPPPRVNGTVVELLHEADGTSQNLGTQPSSGPD